LSAKLLEFAVTDKNFIGKRTPIGYRSEENRMTESESGFVNSNQKILKKRRRENEETTKTSV
jgi:hypothetical protein